MKKTAKTIEDVLGFVNESIEREMTLDTYWRAICLDAKGHYRWETFGQPSPDLAYEAAMNLPDAWIREGDTIVVKRTRRARA